MVYVKNNVWKLFVITMVLGFLMLSHVIYNVWDQVNARHKLEQENITRIVKNSTMSLLSQYEVTLDILGEYLLHDETYKNTLESKNILKNLLKTNSSLAGLGLVNPAGKLYITSIDKSVDKLPNLFDKEETRNSFIKVLKSNIMVLGRTYYHKTLNQYIIPIRKVVKDKDSKVLGVMTAGVKVSDWHFSIEEDNSDYQSFLLRESDYYYQLTPSKSTNNDKLYNTQISSEHIKHISETISKMIGENSDISIEKFKSSGDTLTIKINRFIDSKKVLSSFKYIPKYELWVVVQVEYQKILNEFYAKVKPIVIIYIFVSLFLYFLFYQLSRSALKNRKELEYQAEHDYLTKINNRYYLSKKFDYKDILKPFTLIVINIDNFKNVNKNYGHKYGDLTLMVISRRLEKIKKEDDILVRYSGDEFLFIRYDLDKKDAALLAEKIIHALYESYDMGKFNFLLGSSLGIAQYPSDGKDFDEVKKYADISLQEAKKIKNSYKFFEDNIKLKYLRLSVIEQELKFAVKNKEIYMMYQPQVKADGSIYGVEALVRWNNKELGNVPPDEFISIAEQTGVMGELGQYIIETSLCEICQMQNQINRKFQLSINISLKQFLEVDFYEKLLESIQKAGFDKSYLTLEITETLFIKNVDFILTLLKKIRTNGIKISLDDFGTGYSSLSLLKKLPINELKIDKSFIDDITTDEDSKNMVESIILIGKQFNMSILAEGIEYKEQQDLLDNYNCDMYQGYHFSHPLKIDRLMQYIEEH